MKWKYNQKTMTLDHPFYQVDLRRCNTSAQILDWIAQGSSKTWATPELVGSLVKELNRCLDLQKNICSFGVNRQFNAENWLNSEKGWANYHLNSEEFESFLEPKMIGPVINFEAMDEAEKEFLATNKPGVYA